MNNKVIAIVCADIHLQQTPPACRSKEPNWFVAMARPLQEIAALSTQHNNAAILCSGDVFDRWDSKPELINWAMRTMPFMYCIPGQHDLPFHRLEDMNKSAFWTLVQSGTIEHLSSHTVLELEGMLVHPFPWGVDIEERETDNSVINIALAHQYRWIAGHSYQGASMDQRVSRADKALSSYDVVVFGDNHSGFMTKIGTKTTVFNCGTFMRRRADEYNYRPQVGLIYSDGSVVPHLLDISKDVIDETVKESAPMIDDGVKEFMDRLFKLNQTSLDFQQAIEEYIANNTVDQSVKDVLVEAMETGAKK